MKTTGFLLLLLRTPVLAGVCVLACLALFTGCEAPDQLQQPFLLSLGDKAILSVQTLQPGADQPQTVLFTSSDPERSQWTRRVALQGRLAGMLRLGEAVRLVFRDGTVTDLDLASMQTKRAASPGGTLRLLAAARMGDRTFALRGGDDLCLLELSGEMWREVTPPLPTVGSVSFARLVALPDGTLAAFWRQATGGYEEEGLFGASVTLSGSDGSGSLGAWRLWPVRGAGQGLFALAESGAEPALLEESGGGLSARGVLKLSRWRGDAWEELAPVRLSDESAMYGGEGLALSPDGDGWLMARSDLFGLHVYRRGNLEEAQTRETALLLPRGTSSLWLMGVLTLGALATLVMLGFQRRRDSRNAREATYAPALLRVGGVASPMMRALALFIDMFLVSPLPVLFFLTSNDLGLEGLTPRELGLWFGLSMGGLCLYGAVTEGIWGQTAGKALVGIRVRSASGGPVRFWQAAVRNLVRVVDFFPVPLFGVTMPYLVALVTLLLTSNRKRLGDIAASTLVLLYTHPGKRQYLLASASPRRRELMSALGVSFAQVAPNVDEAPLFREDPEEMAVRLACRKADASVEAARGGEIIIAADTVVALGAEVLGKPAGRDDARRMLRELSGKTHRVYTGVALIDTATGQRMTGCDATEVLFRHLTDAEIDAYVESGEADGKAGAYAVQESGHGFTDQIHGSLSNVAGLPMEMLREMLQELNG